MAIEVRRRRGSTAEHAGFTGAEGELTVDTDKNTVVVHDNTTPGGHPLALEGHTHGEFIPAGGATGQALTKIDSTDYNTQWMSVGLLAAANSWTQPQTMTGLNVLGVSGGSGMVIVRPGGAGTRAYMTLSGVSLDVGAVPYHSFQLEQNTSDSEIKAYAVNGATATDTRISYWLNGALKFTINNYGAFGFGASRDYGTAGYVLTSGGDAAVPTWTDPANWNTAYGWGNHASAGYYSSGGALGTPASGNLANCTFPTLNQNTTGTAAGLSSVLGGAFGGTGVNNSTRTLTYAGNVAFTGAYNVSFTIPGAYTYTFPSANSTLAQLGANTFTGTQTLGNNKIAGVKTLGLSGVYDNGSKSASFTLDCNNGQDQKVTFTGSGALTITLTAPTEPGIYRFEFVNAGLRTITFAYTSGSPVMRKKGGTAFAAFTASGVDMLFLRWNGTDYFAEQSLDWKA